MLFPILLFHSCQNGSGARKIVDAAIERHGGDFYEHMRIQFDFRDKHYTAVRSAGKYSYTREFRDSAGFIKDVLTNTGFTRLVNGDTADLPEKKANAFKNSVNSVLYFALLPYGLNDPAVQKELLGEVTLKGKEYFKVKVTFDRSGGGEDHDDIYVYWFDKEDYSMDYLAYLYYSGEGGIRFREAVNVRTINGITFSDYNNYALESTDFDVTQTDRLFVEEKMRLLSEIDIENIVVKILKTDA